MVIQKILIIRTPELSAVTRRVWIIEGPLYIPLMFDIALGCTGHSKHVPSLPTQTKVMSSITALVKTQAYLQINLVCFTHWSDQGLSHFTPPRLLACARQQLKPHKMPVIHAKLTALNSLQAWYQIHMLKWPVL